MRRLIAAMNMTLDGVCDHTAMIADDEIHEHYNDLLRATDTVLWGRKTYQLMESYWPAVLDKPTGNKPTDEFAVLINDIRKVVFSNTLDSVGWRNARLARQGVRDEILELKRQAGKDIFVGSPSLIVAALNQGLVDEYQISLQPLLAGKGLSLFQNISERVELKLLKTKYFGCGAITLYYEPMEIDC